MNEQAITQLFKHLEKNLAFWSLPLIPKFLKINAVPQKLIFFSIVSPWEPWWHNQAVAQETTMARYLDTLMGSWSQYDGADDFDADIWTFFHLRKILTETFYTILLTKWIRPFLYKNIYKITNFSKYPPRKWSMVNRKGTSFVDGLFRIVPLIIVIVIMTKIMW